MVTLKIRIDRKHTLDLLAGRDVTIKIPAGTEAVNLIMDAPEIKTSMDGLAKCLDVFFNGRKA